MLGKNIKVIERDIKWLNNWFINNNPGEPVPKSVLTSISLIEKYKEKFTKYRVERILKYLRKTIHYLAEMEHSNKKLFKKKNVSSLVNYLTLQTNRFEEEKDFYITMGSSTEEEKKLINNMIDPSETLKNREVAIHHLLELNLKKGLFFIKKMLNDVDEISNPEKTMLESMLFWASKDSKDSRLYINHKYDKLYTDQPLEFFEKGREGSLGYVKRREFEKTGSRTVLLGGPMVGKIIIRIISEEAFKAWKLAFEAKNAWEEAGFDYIPVEPILKKSGKLMAYKTNDGNYRVYTKVLGSSLATVLGSNKNEKLNEILLFDRERIISVLNKLGIEHGHLHRSNFCIEEHNGKIRLYAIDFDMARSPAP